MTKKFDKSAFKNAIKDLVTPWEKGFTCGIVMDSNTKLTTEEYELCSTIARGMIKMATFMLQKMKVLFEKSIISKQLS